MFKKSALNLRVGLFMRVLFFALSLGCGMAVFFMGTRAALAVTLKETSTISGNSITLGDLFYDLEKNAEYVLGPAPRPGKDVVLKAKTLYKIAVAMDLPWRPTKGDHIRLQRLATIIGTDLMKESLQHTLSQQGIQGKFLIHFDGTVRDIVLPPNISQSVHVKHIDYNPERNWFQASLVAPSLEQPEKELRVAGRIEKLVSIPVLTQALRNGDIIGSQDLHWIEVKERSLQHDMILKESDIAGLTPRRMILAGKPILNAELERPTMVERGDMITIIYAEGPLRLTAKGKALQTGARGDTVRVANLSSNRTLDAIVTASQLVMVE